MLAYYITDLAERLAARQHADSWEVCLFSCSLFHRETDHSVQEIEGTFHCIVAVQEAVPVADNPHLRTLFSPEILNRLPSAGNDRIRRTVVILIGAPSSKFSWADGLTGLNRELCVMVHHSTRIST